MTIGHGPAWTSGRPPEAGPSAGLVSVVVPVYQEEAGIERCLATLREQLDRLGRPFELVCVDDGSRDRTPELLDRAAAGDARVRIVSLSRHFGKEAALAAGLAVARGRAVLIMDADLQHPPDLIPRMVELWTQGYDVVNGVKQSRAREPALYRGMARVFNALMGGAAGASLQGASDFKLLDRQVVDALTAFPEHGRFFRGLVAWVGFRVVEVRFTVAERAAGTTRWSLLELLRYSLRNLLAFSAFPLRLMALAGFVTLIFGAGLALWTLYRYVTGTAVTGFTTVILLQLILDGLLLTGIGVIALYLSAIYEESKRRPIYLVRARREADEDRAARGAG